MKGQRIINSKQLLRLRGRIVVSQLAEIPLQPCRVRDRIQSSARKYLFPVFELGDKERLVATVIELGNDNGAIQLRTVLISRVRGLRKTIEIIGPEIRVQPTSACKFIDTSVDLIRA